MDGQTQLPTVTVRGFLNFRTTVDGTVIVFTPASAAPQSPSHQQAVDMITTTTSAKPFPPPTPFSSSSIFTPAAATYVHPQPSIQVTATPVLSQRQPATSMPIYPTGLVTVLAGTVVNNGLTTVYETKVIGTYIEGKYAQILKSTSRIESPSIHAGLIDIIPTRTFAGLWPTTAVADLAPQFVPKIPVIEVEKKVDIKMVAPVFDGASNSLPTSYRNRNNGRSDAVVPVGLRSARLGRTEARLPWEKIKEKADMPSTTPAPPKLRRPFRAGSERPGRLSWTPRATDRVRLNRFKIKVAGVAGGTQKDKEEEEAAKEINQRLNRRLGVTRPQPREPATETSSDIVALAPALEDRRDGAVAGDSRTPVYNPPIFDPLGNGGDEDMSDIDPHRVIKEVQTVTSELTRDVNGHQKVDTVTFTTTVERTLDASEGFPTDGILGSTVAVEANDLDASAIQETPPIVISRTYSITERSTRTSLVPVFDGTSTITHTVTERFFIRKLITGTFNLIHSLAITNICPCPIVESSLQDNATRRRPALTANGVDGHEQLESLSRESN